MSDVRRRLVRFGALIGASLAFAGATPLAAQTVTDVALDEEQPVEAVAEEIAVDPQPEARSTFGLPANLSFVGDVRLVAANGERSWTDGGFGRSRFGADGQGIEVDPRPATAALVWHGPISWNFEGTASIAWQDEQDLPVDLIEAYVGWRPVPRGRTRFSARLGLFWPPVSLEHDGPAWTVSDMITPSAINSWIGEEVKVAGLEGTAAHDLGGATVSATLGVFGFNDTAGALVAMRGWALHDIWAGAFSRMPLPPLPMPLRFAQPQWSTPALEADGRPGFYARLTLNAAPVALDAFYYANGGDPTSVTPELQWGWDTRFLKLGARIDLGPRTRLLAQALTGTTEMGFVDQGAIWVDTRFRAAFLRLTHGVGPVALSGRVDLFDTRQRGSWLPAEDDEQGWALTAAATWRLSGPFELLLEWLHVDSERGARQRVGEAAEQRQDVVQAALRVRL